MSQVILVFHEVSFERSFPTALSNPEVTKNFHVTFLYEMAVTEANFCDKIRGAESNLDVTF